MGRVASADALVASRTDGRSDAAIARRRLLAIERHLAQCAARSRRDGSSSDERNSAAERAHEALRCATVGGSIRLRNIDLPSATVQVLVDEVTSRASTVIEGDVVDASVNARALAYDRDTVFHSLVWEPAPSTMAS